MVYLIGITQSFGEKKHTASACQMVSKTWIDRVDMKETLHLDWACLMTITIPAVCEIKIGCFDFLFNFFVRELTAPF